MRIGFITLTGAERPAPSTRVAVLNMLPYLQSAGHESHFLYSAGGRTLMPELPQSLREEALSLGLGLVVFQKVHGPHCAALARAFEARGVRTMYWVCDVVSPEMAEATSATVVVNEVLQRLYPAALRHKVHVVHDGIERPEVERPAPAAATPAGGCLHAVLVTAQGLDDVPVLGSRLPDWLRLTIVGRYPEEEQWLARFNASRWALQKRRGARPRLDYLRFAWHPRIRRAAWGAESVYEHLRRADIGIIPIVTDDEPDPWAAGLPNWKVRSENRLTLKMAVGLPVVATPIPSYEPVVEQGVNGFLACNTAQWWECLDALRDPGLRSQVGAAARRSVLDRFSKERQAALLLAVIEGLSKDGGSAGAGAIDQPALARTATP